MAFLIERRFYVMKFLCGATRSHKPRLNENRLLLHLIYGGLH